MKKCFSRSFVASPRNYGNLMVGSCPVIMNVELLPQHGVDIWLVFPELAPPVVVPCVYVLPGV
jgi:hypothetical protein